VIQFSFFATENTASEYQSDAKNSLRRSKDVKQLCRSSSCISSRCRRGTVRCGRPLAGNDGSADRLILTPLPHRHLPLQLRHRANGLTDARLGTSGGRTRRMFAQQELRQRREKILECLQVRSAAEKIVSLRFLMFAINSTNMSYASVLYSMSGSFLGIAPEVNALAQRVHRIEMFLPEAVDRIEDDVALQAFHSRGLFVG